jgi:hypothetical protein
MRYTWLLLTFASGVALFSTDVSVGDAAPYGHHSRAGGRHRKNYAQDARKRKKRDNGGSILASGYVRGSGVPFAGVAHRPEPNYLHNVSIRLGVAGSPTGTYCLTLAPGISSFGAIVTVGPAELPYPSSENALPYVTWLSRAPDCASKQLEIRTFTYIVKAGVLNMTPSNYVSFSFIVSG